MLSIITRRNHSSWGEETAEYRSKRPSRSEPCSALTNHQEYWALTTRRGWHPDWYGQEQAQNGKVCRHALNSSL